MKQGVGLFGAIAFAVLVVVGYHFALNKLNQKQFKIFNYQIVITKCGPVVYDRVNKIEKKVRKIEKGQ